MSKPFQTWPPVARRLLALAILGMVLAAVLRFGILPLWQGLQDRESAIAQGQIRLAEFNARGRTLPALRQARDGLRANLKSSPYILQQNNADLAGAELQRRVTQILKARGLVLQSAQVLIEPEENSMVEVKLRAHVVGDYSLLIETLHALESQTPYLVIDRLDLSSRISRRILQRNGTALPENSNLRATFDLLGLVYRSKNN